eukprot:9854234-Alexandrium_andersonii.AAC.1
MGRAPACSTEAPELAPGSPAAGLAPAAPPPRRVEVRALALVGALSAASLRPRMRAADLRWCSAG